MFDLLCLQYEYLHPLLVILFIKAQATTGMCSLAGLQISRATAVIVLVGDHQILEAWFSKILKYTQITSPWAYLGILHLCTHKTDISPTKSVFMHQGSVFCHTTHAYAAYKPHRQILHDLRMLSCNTEGTTCRQVFVWGNSVTSLCLIHGPVLKHFQHNLTFVR